jgi:citrate synthase
MPAQRYLSAAEAAEKLGISRATLYAYVSRGLIRSEAAGGHGRDRRYRREDVERLLARQAQRRHPEQAAAQALSWGVPVLESELTLIADGRLFYRGQDALALARTGRFEDVANLLWLGGQATPAAPALAASPAVLPDFEPWLKLLPASTPVERMQALLPLAAARDAAAYDLRPAAVAQTGARILGLLSAAAIYPSRPGAGRLAEQLRQGWRAGDGRAIGGGSIAPDAERATRLIEAALILCADHELNTSAFTARCVASARGTPYQVVIAGLAALQGLRHGGHSLRVEALLEEVAAPARARTVLEGWLRRGERLPGFGQPLYPDGDPRARALLALARAALPRSRELALAQAVSTAAQSLSSEAPSIDFALVAVARALKLPPGGGLALFALGRTAGWLAQAIEQYHSEAMIRPRARYVGAMPKNDDGR